jgi:anti-anti-sigma regulatory factor
VQTETKATVDQIADGNGGRVTVLRFSGDISSSSHDALLGTYTTVSKSQPVEYINSSGIALVIQMLMEANKNGQKIAAFGLTPHFQKVFTMVGITKYASLYPDEGTARTSI